MTKNYIVVALKNIELLLIEEDFSAYHEIKNILKDALILFNENKKEEAKKKLALSIRFLMEAPPKNTNLGHDTMANLDAAYKSISSIN